MEPMEQYVKSLNQEELEHLAAAALSIAGTIANRKLLGFSPSAIVDQAKEELWYALPSQVVTDEKWDRDGKLGIDAVNWWRELTGFEPVNQMPSLRRSGAFEVRVQKSGTVSWE